jgi:hypothetical protein
MDLQANYAWNVDSAHILGRYMSNQKTTKLQTCKLKENFPTFISIDFQ